MSAAMKFSLLALLGSAAAHPPSYGGHAKYHQKPAGAKPYPVGGWSGNYNSTRVAYPTATGLSVDDKSTTTIDLTTTSTTTLYTTIYGSASPVTSVGIKDIPTGAAACGPATVTVTASEKVTVTVTPGGGANAPKSSATPVASQAGGDYGYPAPSPPAVEKPTTAAVEKPATSQAEGYPVNTPTPSAAISSAVAISSAAPVSSAAPSSSAAPKPSGSPSYAGSKRGLAFNDGTLCSKFGSAFGFAYNWAQTSSDVGAPFVPMMHKPSDSSADEWLANVEKAVKGGSKAVMGFNEPDIAAQANLTPEAACSAWKEYMNPIAESHSDVTIIGPGVSNSNIDGEGLTWLSKFQSVCPDATIHSTNVHFYDIYDEGTVDRFQAHVEKAISMTNKPVWVTEFGLNPGSASPEQAAEFLKGCMKYLDGNDKVQGYSYFMVGTGEHQLNTAEGLSPLGEIYASSN
jgi:hypothetical protein